MKPDIQLQKKRIQEMMTQLGVVDEKIISTIRKIPRELFMPIEGRARAYVDAPQPIAEKQTISQPSLVALMTQELGIDRFSRVLEVGTGSGYQTAVLAELVREVYTVEVRKPLSLEAQKVLGDLGYGNIRFRVGDGAKGWAKHAPFDAIIVTAAAEKVPPALLNQLKQGGRLIIPLQMNHEQELFLYMKSEQGIFSRSICPVRFVSMVTH